MSAHDIDRSERINEKKKKKKKRETTKPWKKERLELAIRIRARGSLLIDIDGKKRKGKGKKETKIGNRLIISLNYSLLNKKAHIHFECHMSKRSIHLPVETCMRSHFA